MHGLVFYSSHRNTAISMRGSEAVVKSASGKFQEHTLQGSLEDRKTVKETYRTSSYGLRNTGDTGKVW